MLITLGAACLRLVYLGSTSLWLDEGATVAIARAPWRHFWWVWWHGEANLQTLYFLLMRGWILFGHTEAWLRLPSVLFGAASVPVLFVLARKLMDDAPALACALLLAVSPTHVYYSQEARSYTLAILLVLLSSYLFMEAVQTGERRFWFLWTVVSLAAVYSHYFVALVLVAQFCSMFFLYKAPWKQAILGGGVMAVAALPGLTYVFRASRENLYFIWMPTATPKGILHLGMFFAGSGVKFYLAMVLWLAGAVAILRGRRLDHNGEFFWRGMLVLLWAFLPAVITGVVSLAHPIFLQRYMIFSLPATLLLAAIGISALKKWRLGFLIVAVLCVASVVTIMRSYRKPREDWRSAIQALVATASPGDAVVFSPFYTRIMFDYYSQQNLPATLRVFAPPYYGAGEDESSLLLTLNAAPKEFQHVWVVVYGPETGQQDLGARSPALAAKLQNLFGAPKVRQFTAITVLEFERP